MKKKEKAIQLSPFYILIIIGTSVFLIEAFIMLVIHLVYGSVEFFVSMFDAITLTVLLFPVLYFFLFHPLLYHIDERKMAEESLRKSEEKFRTLFEESRDAIYISRPDGKLLDINQAGLDLFGYSREELQRIKTEELYVNIQDRKRFIELMDKDGFVIDFEVQLLKKDKTEVDCLLSTILIKDSNGKEQYQGIVHDITERVKYRKELEEALEKAKEGEKIKSLFLANMSHEIRTPLNAMLGFTELLEHKLGHLVGEEEQSFFDTIRTSGERLTRTIHEILDISQIEAGVFNLKPKYLNLIEMTEQLVNQFKLSAKDKGIEVSFASNVTDGLIKADEYCVDRALSNILDNAIKYTKEGKIDVQLSEQNGHIILGVQDTGIGMSKDYQDRIFEEFSQESSGYTKKFQGVGLGLALTKQYLELCNTAIAVESEQGVGSTFTLTFPKAKTGEPSKMEEPILEKPPVPAKKLEKKPTVLVVEDDMGSQQLVHFYLKNECDTIFATTVKEAKERLSEKPVELVLLDLSLVGDEDGLDLVRWMRKTDSWQSTPVIATTAHAFTSDRDNCLSSGCNDYLAKPIKQERLLAKMKEWL
ncbi:MAG: ATP-binding protein [Fidelibacterota bacterium]